MIEPLPVPDGDYDLYPDGTRRKPNPIYARKAGPVTNDQLNMLGEVGPDSHLWNRAQSYGVVTEDMRERRTMAIKMAVNAGLTGDAALDFARKVVAFIECAE